jgi:hypothetical protein
VVVTNTGANTSARLTTNSGYDEAPLLRPVSLEAAGFKRSIRSGAMVTLTTRHLANIDKLCACDEPDIVIESLPPGPGQNTILSNSCFVDLS